MISEHVACPTQFDMRTRFNQTTTQMPNIIKVSTKGLQLNLLGCVAILHIFLKKNLNPACPAQDDEDIDNR